MLFSRVNAFFFQTMPSLSEEEQITVDDVEWAHYMEVEIKEGDLSLRVNHFWTINGLRSTKAAVQEYGHASKVQITLEIVKAVQNSYKLYSQHIREEQQRVKTKQKEKE